MALTKKRKKRSKGYKRPKSVKSLRAKAWKIFSEYIRTRDSDIDGMCECATCNAVYPAFGTGKMQAGHFIPQKACPPLVFDEDNCHAQCSRCNGPGMGEQYAMGIYIRGNVGGDVNIRPDENLFLKYQDYKRSGKKFRWTIAYLEMVISEYEWKLEVLRGQRSITR